MSREILSIWAIGAISDAHAMPLPGEPAQFRISYDENDGFIVRNTAGGTLGWRLEEQVRRGNVIERRFGITLYGIAHVQFLANGWPAGGVPNFALRSVATPPHAEHLRDKRLPFAHDVDIVRAHARIAGIAALGFSAVRLTRLVETTTPGAPRPRERGQWLNFRLSLLERALFESSDAVPALDSDDVLQAGMAGLNPGNSRDFEAIERLRTMAELCQVPARRMPYLAGGFRAGGRQPLLESFAVNASGLEVLGTAFESFRDTMLPSRADRWGQVTALQDGFWWSSSPGVESAPLAFDDALDRIACFPARPGSADRRPVLARLAPRGVDSAAQLAVLDALGLRSAAVAPTEPDDLPGCAGGAAIPYHHLHMSRQGDAIEWRRWIALEADGEDGNGQGRMETSPALLRVTRTAGAPGTDTGPTIRLEGLTDRHFLAIWERKLGGPMRVNARNESGTGGLSLLPDLLGATDAVDRRLGGRWCAEFTCEDVWPDAESASEAGPMLSGYRLTQVSLRHMARHTLNERDGVLNVLTAPPPPTATGRTRIQAAQLRFPGMGTHAEHPLRFAGDIELELDAGHEAALHFNVERDGMWRLASPHILYAASSVITPVGEPSVAIGGLDVRFGRGCLPNFFVSVEPAADGPAYQLGQGDRPLELPVEDVTVGGSDAVERELALQSALWSTALMNRGVLRARDHRTHATGARLLSFDLRPEQGDDASKKVEVTILDPAPMLVAKVAANKLAVPTNDRESAASWQAAQGYWRLTPPDDAPQVLDLTLPPQGVAEAWERRADVAQTHLPPDQVREGSRVPARLVPATEVRLEGNSRGRNQIAPWNLRTILGSFETDLPGARMLAVRRMEVLYGLEAWTGALDGFRLAEMAAWRGVPREPITGQPEREAPWLAGLGAWSRRLAVLDLREEGNPLARPRLGDVRFRLRTKRGLGTGTRHAVPGDNAKFVKPIVDDLRVPAPDADDIVWTPAEEGGILGGAMAGFEQPALVHTLHGRRDGIGELDGFQLSALGAWTRPRAAFQNGLTLISSEVEMGRIHEARFERKGRIGALHHLAKHVIVYRRSFLPARQFAGEQDFNCGRPIVRKVEEYIELTQPVRTYPDRAGATDLDAGPLIGARFRTVRIPVHGSWASSLVDPRVQGYAIPLWRRGEDEAIYPRPVVEMLFAGDPARSEPEPLARRVVNPERLRFYSIIEHRGAEPSGDVDSWPLVYDADYHDRALDNPTHDPITRGQFQHPEDPKAPLPPEAAEAPGLEAFTLLLESGAGINVMQARAKAPTIADLRSVLVMRGRSTGKPSPADPGDIEQQRLKQVIRGAAKGNELAAIARAPVTGHDPIAELKQQATTKLTELRDTLPATNPIPTQRWCDWAHEPANRLRALRKELGVIATIDAIWRHNRGEAAMRLRQLQTQVDAHLPIDRTADALLQPLIDQVGRASAEFRGELTKALESAASAIGNVAQRADAALGDVRTEIAEVHQQVAAGHHNANAALGRMREELAARTREAERLLDMLTGHLPKLDTAAAQLRKAAPKIAKAAPQAASLAVALAEQLESGRERLSDLRANAATALPAKLAKAQAGIGVWRRDATLATDVIHDALREANELIAGLQQGIAAGSASLLDLIDDAPARLFETLETEMGEARARIDEMAKDPLDVLDRGLRAMSAAIGALRRATEAAEPPAELITRLTAAQNQVTAPLDTLLGHVDSAGRELCDLLTQADQLATELLSQWRTRIDGLIREVADFVGEIEALRVELDGYARGIGNALCQLRGGIEDVLDGRMLERLTRDTVTPDGIGEAVALNLLRAAGAPPIVEQLIFNREQIAYHFQSEMHVIVTPVTALVDQADRALRGVGLALPTLGLGEALLAPAHRAFDDLRKGADAVLEDLRMRASDVMKDFAGLKDLLPNLKFGPELASAIRVTHDYDAKHNTAWLQAEINYGPETQDLFRHDAFAVIAERMVLSGVSRYERALAGGERRSVKASIVSDWVLIVGGMALVRIRDAAIRYDERGGLKFDIRPEKIEFPGPLQLLTGLLQDLGGTDSPLSIELLNDPATGRPIGLRSRYDLPPTSFGVGAVSVMNAALGVHLDLAQRSEFEIRSVAYFGRRDCPFAMTVSLLGGGGYVEAEAMHLPASRKTDIVLRVSMGLAAGTGFAFGPLKGSIQVYLGFEASFRTGSAGSQIAITALFVLSGSVTAWGFVTVSLSVRLALTYNGQKLLGHGSIKVEVRISSFYKKRFSRPITYRL
ncbi:coiled-coil domain-containing protein [Novosphingobium aquimarinum]|uniref:hypothetical protein n=1 Tax=Novosphingobium aquimarinum TaxID=2682494 RepID=UPI0018DE4C80|nr:hypothetical protein [Novosphingobium aquimarinum]